jgi:tetratricopeptide (TPR) repeat protein
LLGLFDRPADAASITALRAAPAIPGLTDAFFHIERQSRWFGLFTVEKVKPISDEKWLQTLSKLRRIRMLAERPAQSSQETEDELGAHPLVREHFRLKLKAERPDAWRAGNLRLYEHLTRTAKEVPDTLDEMAPLFAAVAHGCEAGKRQEALEDVYWQRICRGGEFFTIKKLGAFGAGLAALIGFFADPWQELVDGLLDTRKAFVLSEAGFALRALGRLKDAAQPMRTSLQIDISQQDWYNAARVANNLSELYLTLGDVAQALSYARQSMELADQSEDSSMRMASRTKLADALHQVGRLAEAEAAFLDAEALQIKWQPLYPLLYSLRGFLYCDLLLGQGKYQEVQTRAAQSLEWANQNDQGSLLDLALDNLSLGRACLLQSQTEGIDDFTRATGFLKSAVYGLRQAGDVTHLPRGLLAFAALHRLTGDHHLARHDLDEALQIAARGSMRLHEADCHLESARLSLATGDRASARKAWETAKAMVEEMGYHRRDEEVKEIERQLEAD